MAQAHVAEANIHLCGIGGIKFGEDQGMLVDGDLTSQAAAEAAIDADQATKHVAEGTYGMRIKAALDLVAVNDTVASFETGSDVDAIDNSVFGAAEGRHAVL